jgi:hypothetical protein
MLLSLRLNGRQWVVLLDPTHLEAMPWVRGPFLIALGADVVEQEVDPCLVEPFHFLNETGAVD